VHFSSQILMCSVTYQAPVGTTICHVLPHRCLQWSLLLHIRHITNKILNGTPYPNQNELTYNTYESKPKNIENENTNTMCDEKYINIRKTCKTYHIIFLHLKSSKKDLRSQNLSFIPNSQINLNMFSLELVHS
jgi:hypothetical protein